MTDSAKLGSARLSRATRICPLESGAGDRDRTGLVPFGADRPARPRTKARMPETKSLPHTALILSHHASTRTLPKRSLAGAAIDTIFPSPSETPHHDYGSQHGAIPARFAS